MTRDVIPTRPAGPDRHPASASAGLAGSATSPRFRPFLMALTDLDFRLKFVIDNPETPPYGPMFTNFGLL